MKCSNKNRNKVLYIIFIIITLFIIWLFKKLYDEKYSTKEHYITYFLPYYDNKITELTKMYNENDDKKNFFKKKFLYKPLTFIYDDYQKDYITQLTNIIMSKSFLYRTIELRLNDIEKAVEKTNKGEIDFVITGLPELIALEDNKGIKTNNIRYVSKLYNKKVYFFSNKANGIVSLKNISRRFVVGIPSNKNTLNLFINTIMNDMGYIINKDYQIEYSINDYEHLFDLLISGKVDIIVFSETLPNKNLNAVITKKIHGENIILLPFECNNETLFFKENFYFEKEMIDLNNLAQSYLPKKFNNKEYTVYNPSMYMLTYNVYLFSSIHTNENYTYDVTKTIYENKEFLDNNFKDYKIGSLMYKDYEQFLYYIHIGTRKYLVEKSYISFIDSPTCKYLIGKKECNQENINNNIIFNP